MKPKIKISIVGGGPAGGFSAYLLSRQGFEVTLFEAENEVRRKVCGEYLSPSAAELFDLAGLGALLEDNFAPIRGLILVSPKGKWIRGRFTKSKSKAQGYSLNRKRLEEVLLQLAQENGATIRMGTRVKSIQKTSTQYKLTLNSNESFVTDLLIGADGRKSMVAKQLGLVLNSRHPRVALHTFLPSNGLPTDFGQLHLLNSGTYVGLNPINSSQVNFSLVCDIKQIQKLGNAAKVIQAYIKQSSYLNKNIQWNPQTNIQSTYPIRHTVKNTITHHAVLIGDSGGLLDPLTGEGIYLALWSAFTLAKSLRPIEAIGLQPCLKNYALVREKEFRHKLMLSRFFQWVIQRPWVIEGIGKFLEKKQRRGDAFIGILGHLHSPLRGITKILN